MNLWLHAQCAVEQPSSTNVFNGWQGSGQTFIAPCSGPLAEVVKPQGPVPDRIEVRSGSPTGALLYSQLNPVMVGGVHTLTSPVMLAAGSTYAVLFFRASFNNGDGWTTQDLVPGGLWAFGGSSWTSYASYDLQFSVRVLPRISTSGPAGTSFCAGTGFTLPFTVEGPVTAGNTFTAQLSNAAGSFTSPVAIGSVVGTTSGSIACTIPPATPPGVGYRVRVVGSTPAVNGTSSGTDLTITAPPIWYADEDGDGLGNGAVSQSACTQPAGYVSGSSDPCPLAVEGIANFNTATCGCDLGYFATITDIGGNDVITACTICPPGSYCPDGITAFPCAAGAFSDVAGAIVCTSCPAGSFSAATGSTVCTSCPAGSFSDVVGSVSCTSCPAGSFSAVTGSTVCTSCPAGSFSDVVGSVSCTSCPAGSFSAVTGSTVCTSCPAGSFSDVVGSVSCTSCPAGSFSAVTGSTVCTSCPVGTFSAVTGSTACAPCAAGFANGSTGQTACTACPPGSFSANAGQATCTLCPANTFNPLSAQTECLACPNGESSELGATECTPDFVCTTDLVIEFQTDGAPFETTWEIRSADGQTVVAAGGPLVAPFGVQTEFTCVADGCYTFAVLDAAGDGMSTGGYILRTLNDGLRIIDNRTNFSTGSVSALSGGQGFCVPMSTRGPLFTSCDKLDWVTGQYVVTAPDPAVSAEWIVGGSNAVQDNNSGYEFWIFDPNGSYSFRRFRSHNVSDGFGPASATRACHMRLNNWAVASQVPANVLMNVRVRSRVNGVYGPFGPACRLMIDPVRAACPLTKLMDIPGNQFFSCGVFRPWGTGNFVHARSVTGANRYQFRFRIAAEGFEVVRTTTTYFVQLNWPATSAPQLEEGKTYEVDVRVSRDGGATWCTAGPSWGEVCQLTIGAPPVNALTTTVDDHRGTQRGELRMHPNPNRGDLLTVYWDGVTAGVDRVEMELYDLGGKRVGSHQLSVTAGTLNSTVDLGGTLAPGMYMVHVVAGEARHTIRLMVQ